MRATLVRGGLVSVLVVGTMAGESSWGQAYPGRPIRLVVQTAAGSTPDVIIRPIAQKASESVGQPIVVDNRAGAAGVIAAHAVINAPPDGYTILFASSGAMSIAPFLARRRPYDPVQDLAPVTLIAVAPLIVTAHPSLPVKTVTDLIGLAKARPNQLTFASPGAGTVQHLTIEMFSRAAGITVMHVPYKSGAPAVIDTVSGQTQLVITAIPAVLQQVKASRLRALAVTSAKRSPAVPDVPAIAEAGLAGFESVTWYALFAPKNTPAAIVEKLHSEMRKAADRPEAKSAAAHEGVELEVNGPRALAELHRLDMAKWQGIIRDANIILE